MCSGSSSKMCYTFDGCSWTPFATLMDQRHQSASSVIKGNPDRLWLVGGNGGTSKKTSEYLFSNGTVSPGPNMNPGPFDHYGVYGSCVVQLVNGQSLLLGGSGSSGLVRTKVHRYDHNTDTFTEQQPMLYYRYFHACTVFVSAKHGMFASLFISLKKYHHLMQTTQNIVQHFRRETSGICWRWT